MYLSQATTRRSSKPKGPGRAEQQCPRCSKMFKRLDLHLRRSATCSPQAQTGNVDLAHTSPQQKHCGQASITQSSSSTTTPSINTFQLSDLPGFIPTTITTQKRLKVPRSKDKEMWLELNFRIASEVTPRVFEARSLEEKSEALTSGIYHLMSEKCGTLTPQGRKARSHQSPHNRELKEVAESKKQLKRAFRKAKKDNAPKEVIADLANKYHQCVRMHNNLAKEKCKREEWKNAKIIRKKCMQNFWKFSSSLLDGSNDSNLTQPTCSAEDAHSFFSGTYSSRPHTFSQPQWMPSAPDPRQPFQCEEIQREEVERAVKKARAGSSPSPIDQVPYRVLKECPATITPLLHIFNLCWSSGKTPEQWKQAVIKLIPKTTANDKPEDLTCFRPIALTSCVGKIYSSIMKQRLMCFMTGNGYLDTTTQKAFVEGVPGCTEHQFKLWQAIQDARRSQKNITICWLDLANAFGSVHHNLISYALWHYHLPAHFIRAIQSMYTGLSAVISTKQWETRPIHLGKGLFQGDPLSAAIFDVVVNLYIDTIKAECSHMGYRFSTSHHQMSTLQYADDTCLTASSRQNCQAMLDTTEKWLSWSLLKAKVSKCSAISINGQTGRTTNPRLHIAQEMIPYLGNRSTSFLGLPINATLSLDSIKLQLQSKLEKFLTVTDQSPLSRQQKLKIYRNAICPRLTWLLSLADIPLTWVERTLEPPVTKLLKKWCGLSRSADPARIFISKPKGGLDIPSIASCFKKAQVSKYTLLMTAADPTCRFLAERKHAQDTGTHKKLKPTEEVITTMKEYPNAPRKKLASETRKRIEGNDERAHLDHASSLAKESHLFAIKEKGDELWSNSVTALTEHHFAFAMAASVDSLPHNVNLCRWKKLTSDLCPICIKVGQQNRQTLAHVLSHCQAALEHGRYNSRHDRVLGILHQHVQENLPKGAAAAVDLADRPYKLPPDLPTDLRPDLVVHSPGRMHIFELTVCWEANFQSSRLRKESKYLHLLDVARSRGTQASLHPIQVGCRGFLDTNSLQPLFRLTQVSQKEQRVVMSQIIKATIEESHVIWALRNQ